MNSKKCSKCQVEKALASFHWKKTENRPNSWCKDCVYETQKRRWTQRKLKAIHLLGNKCSRCGYDQNIGALQFHHTDPNTKERDWRSMRLLRWGQLVQELKKCSLVCANCHCELHNPQLDKEVIQYSGEDNRLLNIEPSEMLSTGICPICKSNLYGTKYCSVQCSSKGLRKARRPSKSRLKKLLDKMSYCAIGREFGVSDNAVRKWAKGYGLL